MRLRLHVLVFLCLAAKAHTVELKTGERIEGRLVQATSAGVVVEVGGQEITLPFDRVEAIYLGQSAGRTIGPTQSPTREALDAVQDLRSVTRTGIAYQEYSRRVLDAKVKVDHYLNSSPKPDGPIPAAIQLAMRFYELASQGWGASISSSAGRADFIQIATEVGRAASSEPQISTCPAIKQKIDEFDRVSASLRVRTQKSATAGDTRVPLMGIYLGKAPGVFWSCAQESVTNAEASSK